MKNDRPLRQQLIKLLDWQDAHVGFQKAFGKFPVELRGERMSGMPYTAWQLLEHMRIAQWDILDFCRNPNYQELKWPQEYWPSSDAPPTPEAWEQSIEAFRRDLKEAQQLIDNPETDLFAPIPHGSGQTILREMLLMADHNAYHLGQIVLIRKMAGAWE